MSRRRAAVGAHARSPHRVVSRLGGRKFQRDAPVDHVDGMGARTVARNLKSLTPRRPSMVGGGGDGHECPTGTAAPRSRAPAS